MKQAEGYGLWKEAEFELGVARDIMEALNGKGSRRFDNLRETWSHIKQEVKSLEKSPNNHEEIESFLQQDSKKLEESVAHIIAAYFVAGRAIEKMKKAEKRMPAGVKSDKVDLEKRKKNYKKIEREVVRNLNSVDNDIKELDRHLKEVYHEKGGDKQLRAQINFIEALAQCIEEFLSTGDIREGSPNNNLSEEIKTYIDEDIAEMKREKEKKLSKSRKHNDDRWRG